MDKATALTEEEAHRALREQAIGDEMLQFARVLVDADAFAGDMGNFVYFLEKPWKWATEYVAWVKHGRPMEGDATWEAFVEEADDLHA